MNTTASIGHARFWSWRSGAFALLLLAAPHAVLAQPKPEGKASAAPTKPNASVRATAAAAPSSANVTPPDEATKLFKEGIAAHDNGKLVEAEELFRKAWALKQTWDIAANLGLVEGRLGKHAEAVGHLAYALRMIPPTEPAASGAELAKLFEAERAEVGAVAVHANVAGAEVRVGGVLIGTTPLTQDVFVAPGAVAIELRKDGYANATQTVQLEKKDHKEVTFTLIAKEPISEQPQGPNLVLLLGGGAAAVVIAGLGAGLFVAGSDKGHATAKIGAAIRDDGHSCVTGAANYDARCGQVKDDTRAADTMQQAGVGLLIGASVIGAATIGYWVMAPRGRDKPVGVLPVLSPTTGGLVVRGSF